MKPGERARCDDHVRNRGRSPQAKGSQAGLAGPRSLGRAPGPGSTGRARRAARRAALARPRSCPIDPRQAEPDPDRPKPGPRQAETRSRTGRPRSRTNEPDPGRGTRSRTGGTPGGGGSGRPRDRGRGAPSQAPPRGGIRIQSTSSIEELNERVGIAARRRSLGRPVRHCNRITTVRESRLASAGVSSGHGEPGAILAGSLRAGRRAADSRTPSGREPARTLSASAAVARLTPPGHRIASISWSAPQGAIPDILATGPGRRLSPWPGEPGSRGRPMRRRER
jgi:hypothetical protein